MTETQTRLGEATPRVDARLKVTGEARFPSDLPVDNPAWAVLVTSTIARGRILAFHLDAARAVPGLLDILTFENTRGQVKTPVGFMGVGETTTLETDRVMHDGQIIAVVLAETFEAAREAACRVTVDYEEEESATGLDSPGATVAVLAEASRRHHDPEVGDAEAAFAAAPVRLEQTYTTPTQHHSAMELYTATCFWNDGKLTVYEPTQFLLGRGHLMQTFGLPADHIRVVSPFVGGAFGGKPSGSARTALIALAAKRLDRPVKLVATRDQAFTTSTYRAETRHRIKLAADRAGRLQALVHESWEVTSRPAAYAVAGNEGTARFYACPNVRTRVHVVHADRSTPGFMRAPAEAPYMFALESAMDELAVELGIDPVELRRINDTAHDPISGRPYSRRNLMRCFDEGAQAFDWGRRKPEPRAMRDGDWLVGLGCAAACFPVLAGASAARVRLTAEGAKVEVGFHELGQGAYTMIAHVAADRLGLPIGKVSVALGDSDLPPGMLAGGSMGAVTTAHAVADACGKIRDHLVEAAARQNRGALAGAVAATVRMEDGLLVGPGGSEPLETALARLDGAVEANGQYEPPGAAPGAVARLAMGIPTVTGGHYGPSLLYAFGAQFAEVRVHGRTGEVRVPRLVGAFAAGKIINQTTAHSQLTGGMIWGISSALHEATEMDPRTARYVNENLGEYMIPVNADIGEIEAFFVEDDDPVNPMGLKGVGEIGMVGLNAAIANAVFNATGKRIRDLPIRMHQLL